MNRDNTINRFYWASGACIIIFLFLTLCGDISNQQHVIAPSLKRLQTDFFCVLRYISERDPYNSPIYGLEEKPYFPIAYLLMYPFTLFFDYRNTSEIDCLYLTIPRIEATIFALVSLIMWVHSMARLCKKYSTSKWFILLSMFSSCFLFSMIRGSYVTISTACIMYFLYYYDLHDKKAIIISVLAISFASLLKVYPVVFALLWFNKGNYKKIFQIAIVCLIVGILPFFFFKGGLDNIEYMLRNITLQGTKFQSLLRPDRMGIISLAVQFNSFTHIQSELIIVLAKITNYLLLLVSVALIFMTKKKWLQLLLMSCLSAVFPVSGFIYNLTLLIPVFVMILGYYYKEMPFVTLNTTVILFFLSMVPIQIVYHGFSLSQVGNNLAGILLWLYTIITAIKTINNEKLETKILK